MCKCVKCSVTLQNLGLNVGECVFQTVVAQVKADEAQVCAVSEQVKQTLLIVARPLNSALCGI